MHLKIKGYLRERIACLSIILSLFMLAACSSGKIKELTTVELARQIYADQQKNNANLEKHPIKMNYVVSNKPVIGKETEVEIELVSEKELPYVTLAFEPSAHLRFNRKWLLLKRDSVTKNLSTIKPDTLYRYKVVIVPEKEGVLHLTVYAMYQQKQEKRVKKTVINFSIGMVPKAVIQ